MLTLKGGTHVSFSVRDLDASREWYQRVLGLKTLVLPFESEHYRETILLAGSLGLCLQQHFDNTGEEFSEHRTGLDHLAFRIETEEEFEAWLARFEELGVPYDVQKQAGFGSMVVFRDPDNIQLELHIQDQPNRQERGSVS